LDHTQGKNPVWARGATAKQDQVPIKNPVWARDLWIALSDYRIDTYDLISYRNPETRGVTYA